MRRVRLSDLDLAARAVMAAPPDHWDRFARQLIEDAHRADAWRKAHATAHSSGGTGSLYAQASLYPSAASSVCDADYCTAFGVVLRALAAWRDRTNRNS